MADAGSIRSLGQMVRLLAANLHRQNVPLPFKDQEKWHSVFYNLKTLDEQGKPQFLDNLIFDWDAPFPKCEELSDFLNAMHVTANVAAHNPLFEVITVADEDADRWSRNAGELTGPSQAFLNSATEIARREFSAPQA